MLYKKGLWLLCLLIVSCIIMAQTIAGTIRHDIDDDKYVANGVKHQSVVRIHGNVKNPKEKNLEVAASAVAIKPRWILTAAHIITCSTDQYIVTENNQRYNLDLIIVHHDFNESLPLSMSDIALCRVSKGIDDIKKFPLLYSSDKEEKRTCTISGYGMFGTGLTGAKVFDGKRRAGTNRIAFTNEYILVCDMSENDESRTALEFLPAHGDSGGALFIDGKLAGINSFISALDKKPDSTYGDESAHTRISTFKPWIIETIKKYEKD